MRCKYLAEKYFNMIKDMKNNLHQMRVESAQEIKGAQIQLRNELVSRLEHHLSTSRPPVAPPGGSHIYSRQQSSVRTEPLVRSRQATEATGERDSN